MHTTHPAGNSVQRPGNPVLQGLLKTPQAVGHDATARADSSDNQRNAVFTKIYSESSSADYADAAHARQTKEKHLQSQEALINLGKLEVRISALRKELKAARSAKQEKAVEKIGKELKALTSEKKALMADAGLKDRSASRQTVRPANPDVGTPANSPARSCDVAASATPGRAGKSSTSSTSAVGHAPIAALQDERMVQLNDMLEARLAQKKAMKNQLAALKQTHAESSEISATRTKLRELETQIHTLQEIIATFSSTFAAEKDVASPVHPVPSSKQGGAAEAAGPPMRELIRRTTTRQREKTLELKPLKRSENLARNSTLYPQGLHHLLTRRASSWPTRFLQRRIPCRIRWMTC